MFTKLLRRTQEEKGFTLIELLVVILIIGILAAIAIPAFLNQKGKAYDSNAKSDARTAATAQETYFTDNNAYANGAAGLTSLESLEPTLNQAAGAANESLAVDAPGTALYGAPALSRWHGEQLVRRDPDVEGQRPVRVRPLPRRHRGADLQCARGYQRRRLQGDHWNQRQRHLVVGANL